MLDLQELQVLAQLVDNMDLLIGKIEDSYAKKDGESFNKARTEFLNSQMRIAQMTK